MHHDPVPEQRFDGDPAAGHGRWPRLKISADELYGELWAEDPSALEVELGRSLEPRATTMLYDEFDRLGDAVHAIELVRRSVLERKRLDPCLDDLDPVLEPRGRNTFTRAIL
jgi:hypothetical protein